MINSTIKNYFMSLGNIFSGSIFWKTLTSIHLYFRKSFQNSSIISCVKHEGETEFCKTSILCRILGLPLFIVSYIAKILSGTINSFVSSSLASHMARGYLNGFLSLNISFFALMMMCSGAVSTVMALLTGKNAVVYLILTVLGAILSLFKVKLSKYLDKSIFVKFFKSSFGFDASFNVPLFQEDYSYTLLSALTIGCISGLLTLVSPLLIAAPLAVFALTALLVYPTVGLMMTVFFAPILPTIPVIGLCLLTTASSVLNKSYKKDFKIKCGRVGYAILMFLAVLLISTIFSYSKGASIGVLGMYMIFATFYFTVINEAKSKKTFTLAVKLFVISGAAVSIYGIMQYLFGWTTSNAWIDTDMFEEATMRVYSTLANPNVLGEYLLLALPLGALCFVEYTKGLWQKIVYALMFALTLLCLVLTQSRGCWIGFFVSAFIFITYYKSEIWKLLPFLLLLLPFVLPDTIINRFLSVGNMSDSSTSYRVYIWFGTLLMLKDFWLGGIGLGEKAFRSVYPYYSYAGIVAPHSHNLYLQLIVESGICGLVCFAFMMTVFFKDTINTAKRSKSAGCASYAIASGVLGFLVQSMFDYTFYNYRVMGIFFIILAFGTSVKFISAKEEANEENN